jgi:hypothetical protein
MNRTQTLLAALLLGLMLTVAGCGSDGGSDGDIASATGKESTESKDSATKEDREAFGLKFAKCMRDHGIDMEDPKPGEGIRLQITPDKVETMKKAQDACKKYLPQKDGATGKERSTKILEFAQCMRKNGVEDFPDPKDGRMSMKKELADDPDFEKAQEACQDLMGGPFLKQGGKA